MEDRAYPILHTSLFVFGSSIPDLYDTWNLNSRKSEICRHNLTRWRVKTTHFWLTTVWVLGIVYLCFLRCGIQYSRSTQLRTFCCWSSHRLHSCAGRACGGSVYCTRSLCIASRWPVDTEQAVQAGTPHSERLTCWRQYDSLNLQCRAIKLRKTYGWLWLQFVGKRAMSLLRHLQLFLVLLIPSRPLWT